MLLFRGEAEQFGKKEKFEVLKGNSELMSESGPGVGFFVDGARYKAAIYALSNPDLYLDPVFDEDGNEIEVPEHVDNGYFYSAYIDVPDLKSPKVLNNISPAQFGEDNLLDMLEVASKINGKKDIFEDFYDEIDGFDLDEDELNDSLLDKLNDHYSNYENMYDVVIDIYERINPYCNNDFVSRILPNLREAGGVMAYKHYEGGLKSEVIVYDTDEVVISSVISITKERLMELKDDYLKLRDSGVDGDISI